jgi:Fe2+ or Zn2+ uptake regulation protein
MSTDHVSAEEHQQPSLSRNEIYEILSNPRRRYSLHAIKNEDGTAELSTLAEQVAAWENNKPVSEVTSGERHLAYSSIQQNHIPKLERAGIITHDTGTIELTEEARDLDVYVDVVPGDSIPWAEYYLGLGAVSLGLVAAVWAGVFPESIPGLAWAAIIAVLFTASAAYHAYQNREMNLGSDGKPPELRDGR